MESWFIFVCILKCLKMAKYILIQTSLHSCLFFLVRFSISMTNKEVFNAICLVGDLLELKCRRKIWKACQNWNVFRDFCKKCLWKYFCWFCFLTEGIAGNSNWKNTSAICLKHVGVLFYKEETIPKWLLFRLLISFPSTSWWQ